MPTLLSAFGVEPRRIGGTETFARELSTQLGQRGWDSVLCFLSDPTPEVRRFLTLPNTSLDVFGNASDSGLKIGQNLARILRRNRPDVLHLHYVGFVNLYSWLARIHSVNKIFFTDHFSRPSGYQRERAPLWKRGAARIVNDPLTKVICVSNYGHECMSSIGFLPAKRFQMIYNGVDLSRVKSDPQHGIDFKQRYSIPLNRAIVTQVSWVIPEKGIIDFLETARIVTSQNPDVQFVVVGEGAYREEYMKLAVEMGIQDRVTWTGMVEDPFSEGVFEAADVVCQFSRWEEVFGWMIAEAMAHGRPVVATRVGGIPELVQNAKSGYLVDRGDTQAMSQQVLTLLKDADLRKRMGQTAAQITRERFNLRNNVTELISSYKLDDIGARAQEAPALINSATPVKTYVPRLGQQ